MTTVTKKPPAKPESVDDETSEDEKPNEPTARKMVKTKKPSPSSLPPLISSLEPGAFVKDTADEGELAKYKLTTGNKKPTAKPKSADDETSKDEELNETTARKKVKAKKSSPSSLPPSIRTLIPIWPYPQIPYIPYIFLIHPNSVIHPYTPCVPYISIHNPLPNLAKKRKIESYLVDSDDESSDD